jgi:hypothetical protein
VQVPADPDISRVAVFLTWRTQHKLSARVQGVSCGPIGTEQVGLLQHQLGCFLPQVRGEAVLIEDAPHHHADLGSGAFPFRPIDRDC